MGVTSILSDARNEFRLFSGSYDEKLNIWDTRFEFQLHLKKASSDGVNGLRERGVREEKTDSVLISTMSRPSDDLEWLIFRRYSCESYFHDFYSAWSDFEVPMVPVIN